MARILIAVIYIAAILIIGILAGRKVKTSDEFATADHNIPFWTNVFSMSSAWIGAGSTLGCASISETDAQMSLHCSAFSPYSPLLLLRSVRLGRF